MCACRAAAATILPTGPGGRADKFLKCQCKNCKNSPPEAEFCRPSGGTVTSGPHLGSNASMQAPFGGECKNLRVEFLRCAIQSDAKHTSLKFFDEEILYEEGPTSGGGGDGTASHRRGPRCSNPRRLYRRRRRAELDVQHHHSGRQRLAADGMGTGWQDRLRLHRTACRSRRPLSPEPDRPVLRQPRHQRPDQPSLGHGELPVRFQRHRHHRALYRRGRRCRVCRFGRQPWQHGVCLPGHPRPGLQLQPQPSVQP